MRLLTNDTVHCRRRRQLTVKEKWINDASKNI